MDIKGLVYTKLDNSNKKAICLKCKYVTQPFVPSSISESDVAIIGEAPGRTEANLKCPFTGPSGKLLRELLRDIGLDDKKFSYFNVVFCNPPENETPNKKAIRLCFDNFLLPSLYELGFEKIVLVGGVALEAFFPNRKIMSSRGVVLEKDGIKYLPVLHPAFCLRNRNYIDVLRKDLNMIKKFDSNISNGKKSKDYVLISNIDEAEKYFKILSEKEVITIDIETSGLNPFANNARILTIAFCYQEYSGICFPIDHYSVVDEKFKERSKQIVKELLESKNKKVFHNASFDIKYLEIMGYKVCNVWCDTMILAHLIDENRKSYSLKTLAPEFLEEYQYNYSENIDVLYRYNCEDADFTLRLYDLFYSKLDKQQKELFHNILVPASLVIADMELNGIKIDIDYCRKLVMEYNKLIEETIKNVHSKFPESVGINFNSSKQLRKLFFDAFKIPSIKKTPTKVASVDGSVLEGLSEKGYEIADYILKLRKYEKLLSTYILPWPKMIDNDGRIRGSFHITGTVTGRLSSSEPNLQNIPRDKKIKKIFIAEKSNILINVDASQAELRVACSIANEKTMIKAYNNGVDVHNLTASEALSKEIYIVTEEDRQGAKGINFGFIYGSSAEGYRRYVKSEYGLDVSLEDSELFRNRFFSLYSGFPIWYQKVREEVTKNKSIRYPTGRYRRFPEMGYTLKKADIESIIRMAINSPVQGTSSDIILFTMVCLKRFLDKTGYAKILLTVHDQFLLEGKEEYQNEVIAEIDNIANYDIPKMFSWLKVPWVFDYQVGYDWGEMKKV